MNQNPPTDLDLDEIASRAAHLYEYVAVTVADAEPDFDQLSGTDVPALIDEVRRQRAYEQRLREQHDHDVEELNRLRSRVAELERPAIEAKRNEIRDSYADLINTCQETKDFEGAFDVQCRLREREEQWKREDAATPAPAVSGGEQ